MNPSVTGETVTSEEGSAVAEEPAASKTRCPMVAGKLARFPVECVVANAAIPMPGAAILAPASQNADKRGRQYPGQN